MNPNRRALHPERLSHQVVVDDQPAGCGQVAAVAPVPRPEKEERGLHGPRRPKLKTTGSPTTPVPLVIGFGSSGRQEAPAGNAASRIRNSGERADYLVV